MKLANETIEILSEKFARQFTYRMPSAAHLLADLKQEAAIAVITHAPRWRKNGGANLETFTRIYAWRAMQELCTTQSGPVSKPMNAGKFEGTFYATGTVPDFYDHHSTPDSVMERKDADAIVREFIDRRAERFTGNGKLSIDKIKNALRDLMSGDTCVEVGKRYGTSKQHMSMLAAQAEIA